MRKILISFLIVCSLLNLVNADYFTDSVNSFINSPSVEELNSIEDENQKYCEEVFLRAYMRRDFTDIENEKCSDVFEQKIEAQLNYMKYMSWERGVY